MLEPLGVPTLQTSDESAVCGFVSPVHEKPNEPPVQPTIVESAAHPDATVVSSMQQ